MKRTEIFFIGMAVLVFACIYLVFTSSIVVNPLQPANGAKTVTNQFFPEGWAFFTRDPKEALLDVYMQQPGGNVKKMILPNADYMLGASRKSRILCYQLGSLLGDNREAIRWKSGTGNFTDSLSGLAYQGIKENEKFTLFKKGKYILVSTEKLPWLWAKNALKTKPRFKIAAIEIN
jgi:antimicrobial peptide system SdpA family protein